MNKSNTKLIKNNDNKIIVKLDKAYKTQPNGIRCYSARKFQKAIGYK